MSLFITPGEPAGIGPDLLLDVFTQAQPAALVGVADTSLLRARAEALSLDITFEAFDDSRPPGEHRPGHLPVLDVPLRAPVTPGTLDAANADYVLQTLVEGVKRALAGGALVTGPVHKGIINAGGHAFTGHTEFLAEHAGGTPVMMLITPGLRVALATTHLPLRSVADKLNRRDLTHSLRILDADLRKRFGLERPSILVTGLNPHAGEDGHLGREEIDIIGPVIAQLRDEGLDLHGPVPADSAFTPQRLQAHDAIMTMYHDQGLPVLKALGFGSAVNVTLGLPIVRTSVDHGTALELAASGRAQSGSLQSAIDTAATLLAAA